jgi:hypothetical protein
MSQRNGDRSRSHAQKRHKSKLRERRRELSAGLRHPVVKVVSIDGKKTAASDT